jgi:ribosomal protein L5
MNSVSYFNTIYLTKTFLLHNATLLSPLNLSLLDKILMSAAILDSSTEKNTNFSKTTWLLEHVATRKTFTKNYKTKRVGRNERRVVFSISVAIRKSKMFNFLYFFSLFVLPNFKKKLLRMPLKLNLQGNYLFLVKDISVFPGYLETFFKWRYFLFFQVSLNRFKKYPKHRGSKITNRYLLQDLSLILK